jgi:hypothetical protein
MNENDTQANESAATTATTATTESVAPAKAPKKAKAKAPAKKAAKKAAKKKSASKSKGVKADGVSGPAVLKAYAPQYHRDKEKKTASGNVSVDCGDELAARLRGKSLDDVYAFAAKALKEPEADLRKQYKHLNVGMQRMNLGNRVRAALK